MEPQCDQVSLTAAQQTLTVGLLWHTLTSNNLGVGALTLSQMMIITEAARRREARVRFITFGHFEEKSYQIENFEIIQGAVFSRRAFLAGQFKAISLLRQCDIVFDINEGDSFSDIYGNKRLMILVFPKLLALFFRRPLILSPQTIGPFKSFFGKQLGNIGMRIAVRIYARDHLSMQLLEQSKYLCKSKEVIDVAFALPFKRPIHENGDIVRIGINVSGLLYNGGYSGRNEFMLSVDYPTLVMEACKYFLAQPNVEVYLVPHVFNTSSIEDDLHVSKLLLENHPQLKLAPCFRSPIEAKNFISGLDFFTGARMHACIAAFSSGVPVIPMAYSRKFTGLFNSLEYFHVLDCLTLDTHSALQRLFHAFEHRNKLAIEIKEGNKIAHDKLEIYTEQISKLLPIQGTA